MSINIKKLLKRIFLPNQITRDNWIKQQALKVKKGARVLDVGAGSCLYRKLFAHCEYKTQDFVQLNDNQLFGNKYGKIDYVSDICSIPVEKSSFDVIICTEVLEHLPEPILAIREFARILKPEGRLIITAPLGSGLHQLPYHYYGGYTPNWYENFLGLSGFEDILVEANGNFFRFFGQECVRFVLLTAPWKSLLNFVLLPLWIINLLLLAFYIPVYCICVDKFDRLKTFTIGYHVTACRVMK